MTDLATTLIWAKQNGEYLGDFVVEDDTVSYVGQEPTAEEIAEWRVKANTQLYITALTERFREARDSGTTVDFGDGNPVSISTTHDAQQELAALATRLEGGGTQRAATRSGVVIEWTGPMAAAAVSAIEDHISACYTNDADLSEAITAAADPATVDINVGWP